MKVNALGWGAGLAFVAVGAGAFGSHALKARIAPEMLTIWQTAVQYHLAHAIALVLIGILGLVRPHPRLNLVAALFLGGIAIFGGTLYTLSTTGIRILGAITPLGGLCFLGGWLNLALISKELASPSSRPSE